jgi:hypothetical protein
VLDRIPLPDAYIIDEAHDHLREHTFVAARHVKSRLPTGVHNVSQKYWRRAEIEATSVFKGEPLPNYTHWSLLLLTRVNFPVQERDVFTSFPLGQSAK